jgi:hypothetical protein
MRPMAVVVNAILSDDDLQMATTESIRSRHSLQIVPTKRQQNHSYEVPDTVYE